VIGGLISSTLLTLVLVPTLYTMVENRKEKSRAKRERKRLAKDAGTPKHAADEPVAEEVPADAPAPETSGGAHEAPPPEKVSGALRGYTDQFEVLKMPRKPANPPPA